MSFDPMLQRRIMGRFATGVTVITTRHDETFWGMTANAVLSLSLDPPLMLVSIDRRSQMHEYIVKAQCFAVNILTAQQEHLSRRFAMRGPKDFSGIAMEISATGAPIFLESLAFVDCRLEQVVEGGDHDMMIGTIVAGALRDGNPLLFYAGQYASLAPPASAHAPVEGSSIDACFDHYGSF